MTPACPASRRFLSVLVPAALLLGALDRARAGRLQGRRRHLPVRRRRRPLRRAGQERGGPVVESLNAGKVPAPYAGKGFGGRPIELVIIDEAGGTTKQVSEFRNLVQRQNVDFVIGYISSGDCLAVAPVAEELKKLTIFFDCGTPRIFEDAAYKYVFRTGRHATMDDVAAALYLLEKPAQGRRRSPASTRTTPGARTPGTTSRPRCRS